MHTFSSSSITRSRNVSWLGEARLAGAAVASDLAPRPTVAAAADDDVDANAAGCLVVVCFRARGVRVMAGVAAAVVFVVVAVVVVVVAVVADVDAAGTRAGTSAGTGADAVLDSFPSLSSDSSVLSLSNLRLRCGLAVALRPGARIGCIGDGAASDAVAVCTAAIG